MAIAAWLTIAFLIVTIAALVNKHPKILFGSLAITAVFASILVLGSLVHYSRSVNSLPIGLELEARVSVYSPSAALRNV